jgi:hypothetical protein
MRLGGRASRFRLAWGGSAGILSARGRDARLIVLDHDRFSGEAVPAVVA